MFVHGLSAFVVTVKIIVSGRRETVVVVRGTGVTVAAIVIAVETMEPVVWDPSEGRRNPPSLQRQQVDVPDHRRIAVPRSTRGKLQSIDPGHEVARIDRE